MTTEMRCPRCLSDVRPPGLHSSRWSCATHGEIAPLHPARTPDPAQLRAAAARTRVPLWLPWPLPRGWVASGVQTAGDDHQGGVASVLALTGPNPFRDGVAGPLAAEMLLVAEQPGVGLAGRLGGIGDVDAGVALAVAMDAPGPHAVVEAAGHDVPLWCVEGADDRACYVGEAASVWLWLIVLPATAGAITLDGLRLVDLRDPGHPLDVPAGALTPHLP